jgi:exonuclease VII large subunit
MSGSPNSRLLAYSLPALAALVVAAQAFAFDGPDQDQDPNHLKNRPDAKTPANPERLPTPDPEAAALAFVREHHPELADLLQQLKPMKPAEYERAVRELALISRNLAALKARNPRAYELGLDVWKARSRVELLTARLASASGPSPELESRLRRAVEDQLDAEVRQQKFKRDQVEQRLKNLEENLDRLESRRDSIIESRYQAFVKKGQRARQQNRQRDRNPVASKPKAKAKPKAPAPVEGNTDANSADPDATTTKGERQP